MIKEGTVGSRLFFGDAVINYGSLIMKALYEVDRLIELLLVVEIT